MNNVTGNINVTTNIWMSGLLIAFGVAFLFFMGALCALLIWKMWKGYIKLDTILEEANGDASVSRFQFLLFSLIVAVGIFLYIVNQLTLPPIPNSILILIGISSSTYAVGKGISYSRPEGVTRSDPPPTETPDPAAPPATDPQTPPTNPS